MARARLAVAVDGEGIGDGRQGIRIRCDADREGIRRGVIPRVGCRDIERDGVSSRTAVGIEDRLPKRSSAGVTRVGHGERCGSHGEGRSNPAPFQNHEAIACLCVQMHRKHGDGLGFEIESRLEGR